MSASQSSTTSASSQAQEYVVRVPKNTEKKRHHVMRFNSSMNIDFATWSQGRLERENNQKDAKLEEEMPKFGAGSEYGRQQREEAKRRKYGMASRKYNPDDQPWLLRIGGKAGKKYRGLREGGVTENASYYVFKNASDGAFEAFPLEEWYNFIPIQTYKTLNAEEAEEEFGRRDKVFNYFSIMMKKRLKADEGGGDGADGDENPKKGGKKGSGGDFKISDMDDWVHSSDGEDEDEEKEDGSDAEKKKVKNNKKKPVNKKKKKKAGSDDDEAIEESDDGDDEGREVDYISDESSSSEDLNETKNKGELKGVEDEEAIRKMEDSESEEENEEEEKKEATAEVKEEPAKDTKAKREESSSETSSDTSDSDFDSSFHSAMFMPDKKSGNNKKSPKKSKKESNSNRSNTSSRSGEKNTSNDSKRPDNDSKLDGFPNKRIKSETSHEKNELKRSANDGDKLDGFSAKRLKLEHGGPSTSSSPSVSSLSIDGITEDAVRRYLMRKPMTTIELIQKFKSKKTGLSRDQMVNTITQILKRLNPDKQMIKGKMYLSVKHSQ